MIKKLLNPFKYIAGGYALFIGVVVILITSFIGYLSNTHFPDVISVKASFEYPLSYYIIQNLANWIVISIILYLVSILFSTSKVRVIDIFGTQALSRAPYLLAAFIGFSGSLEKFGKYILWKLLEIGEPVNISTTSIVFAIIFMIVTLVLTIWLIILMFNAFRVASNIKGAKSVILFIIALLLSIFISAFTTNQLIQIL